MNWFQHAFAVDKPGLVEPSAEQQPIIETVCAEVVRRRLVTPTLLFLEMSRPLNNLGAQTLHFLTPFLSVLTTAEAPTHLADFLEQRGSIDYLCQRIEHLNDSATKKPNDSAEAVSSDPTDPFDSTDPSDSTDRAGMHRDD